MRISKFRCGSRTCLMGASEARLSQIGIQKDAPQQAHRPCQKAENGGLHQLWLDLRKWGNSFFFPKNLSGFWHLWTENRRPPKKHVQQRQTPLLGSLTIQLRTQVYVCVCVFFCACLLKGTMVTRIYAKRKHLFLN